MAPSGEWKFNILHVMLSSVKKSLLSSLHLTVCLAHGKISISSAQSSRFKILVITIDNTFVVVAICQTPA